MAPTAIARVIVVVPAHDEAGRIADCIGHVLAAAAAAGPPATVRVVLDSCADDTGARVPAGRGGIAVETREIAARNVGAARAAGIDPADLAPGTWLAHTDADTLVDPGWLRAQIAHADAGADAVIGTVGVIDWGRRPAGLDRLHAAGYRDRPGHRHVHGANLGVRGSAYAAAGGFRPLAVGEDVDLVRRLHLAGARLEWAADCRVRTSARVSRRTGGGFSGFLDGLGADAAARLSAAAARRSGNPPPPATPAGGAGPSR